MLRRRGLRRLPLQILQSCRGLGGSIGNQVRNVSSLTAYRDVSAHERSVNSAVSLLESGIVRENELLFLVSPHHVALFEDALDARTRLGSFIPVFSVQSFAAAVEQELQHFTLNPQQRALLQRQRMNTKQLYELFLDCISELPFGHLSPPLQPDRYAYKLFSELEFGKHLPSSHPLKQTWEEAKEVAAVLPLHNVPEAVFAAAASSPDVAGSLQQRYRVLFLEGARQWDDHRFVPFQQLFGMLQPQVIPSAPASTTSSFLPGHENVEAELQQNAARRHAWILQHPQEVCLFKAHNCYRRVVNVFTSGLSQNGNVINISMSFSWPSCSEPHA